MKASNDTRELSKSMHRYGNIFGKSTKKYFF